MSITPAPWRDHERAKGNIIGANGRLVANTAGYSESDNMEKVIAESEANARLIAAAPDLLEALEVTFEALTSVTVKTRAAAEILQDAAISAAKALSKATGKEPS